MAILKIESTSRGLSKILAVSNSDCGDSFVILSFEKGRLTIGFCCLFWQAKTRMNSPTSEIEILKFPISKNWKQVGRVDKWAIAAPKTLTKAGQSCKFLFNRGQIEFVRFFVRSGNSFGSGVTLNFCFQIFQI